MRNVMKRKIVLLLIAVALLLTVAVGGTVAYLSTRTGEVKNTFEPANVVPKIQENFTDKTVKKDVRIQNAGNVDAYIRVALIGNWCDKNGDILSGVNVELTPDPTNWFKKDGFYYYSKPVAAGGYTGYLIGEDGYTPNESTKPEGADHFNMDILAQAIQAEGVSNSEHPVALAWGVTVNENNTPADYSDDTISSGN